MPFKFQRLGIPDVISIQPQVFSDGRGYFLETYKQSDFEGFGINVNFVQHNFSCSDKNTLRGLHFQKGCKAQGKLVRVTNGRVFDVAVDIRVDSPSFGKYVSEELSGENHHMLWIPPGFAHGFLSLEDSTQLHYKCTDSEYDPSCECTLAWDDPTVCIEWPLRGDIRLSDKDEVRAISLHDLKNTLMSSL